jgi:hypothetical protein
MSSPLAGLRVNATPVAEVSPMLPNTIACTFTAVPHSWGCLRSAAVGDGALAHPGLEHGLDAAFELLHGVVGEGLAQGGFHGLFEIFAKRLEVFRGQIGVFRDAALLLEGVELVFELVADALAVLGLGRRPSPSPRRRTS